MEFLLVILLGSIVAVVLGARLLWRGVTGGDPLVANATASTAITNIGMLLAIGDLVKRLIEFLTVGRSSQSVMVRQNGGAPASFTRPADDTSGDDAAE